MKFHLIMGENIKYDSFESADELKAFMSYLKPNSSLNDPLPFDTKNTFIFMGENLILLQEDTKGNARQIIYDPNSSSHPTVMKDGKPYVSGIEIE